MPNDAVQKNIAYFTPIKPIDSLVADYYYHGRNHSKEKNHNNTKSKQKRHEESLVEEEEGLRKNNSNLRNKTPKRKNILENKNTQLNRSIKSSKNKSSEFKKSFTPNLSNQSPIYSNILDLSTNKIDLNLSRSNISNIGNNSVGKIQQAGKSTLQSIQSWMDSYESLSDPYELSSPKSSLQKQPFLIRQTQSDHISSPLYKAATVQSKFSSRKKPFFSNGRNDSRTPTKSRQDRSPQPQYLMTENGIITAPFTRAQYSPNENSNSTNPLLKKKIISKRSFPNSKLKAKIPNHFSLSTEQLIKKLQLNTTKSYLSLEYHPLWKEVNRESDDVYYFVSNTTIREKWNQLAPFFKRKITITDENGKKSEVFDKQFNSNLWIKYVKKSLIQEMGRVDDSKRIHNNDYEVSFDACFELAHEDLFVVDEEDDNSFMSLKMDISTIRMKQKMSNHVLFLLTQLAEYCSVIEAEKQAAIDEEKYWREQLLEQEEIQSNLIKDRKVLHKFLKEEDENSMQLINEIDELEKQKKLLQEMIEYRKKNI